MEYADRRTNIIERILRASQDNSGTTRSALMYGAFLSYVEVDEQLGLMVENNLLRYDNETMRYRITTKGLDFLKTINRMKDLLDVIEEEQ